MVFMPNLQVKSSQAEQVYMYVMLRYNSATAWRCGVLVVNLYHL